MTHKAADQPLLSKHAHRSQAGRFFLTAAGFIALLIVMILIADTAMGAWLKSRGPHGILCPDVHDAVEESKRVHKGVRIVFLGDSVSRQLFRPGTEGRADVKFLTTNAAISIAGQYYLAESTMEHFPDLHDIYLFYLPFAWKNNLPPAPSHDYFCGHFHSAGQVVEMLKVKRDFGLSIAHAGRWLMPNIMAANSLSRPAFALAPMDDRQNVMGTENVTTADPDRLITQLSEACGPAVESLPTMPAGYRAIKISPVSRYYLAKLRRDCQSRGIRLHVLPSPVSDQNNGITYVDAQGLYDAPIIGDIPPAWLRDGIHFRREYVQAARDRIIMEYKLSFLSHAATPDE